MEATTLHNEALWTIIEMGLNCIL